MDKKWIKIVFVGTVFALCIGLAAGVLFAGPSPAGANEVLAKAPSLKKEDGSWNAEVLSDSAAWFSDHFFLRQQLISAHNGLFAKALGTSGAEDVLLGKGGWLYYRPTLADYTGMDPMTERELFCAANNLSLMAEYCEGQGRQFLFVIAPNKNSLYGEHMPDYGAVSAQRDAQRLHRQLSGKVRYVDLFSALEGEEEVLYFAHDSHWNSKGAALAADLINEEFGKHSAYYKDDFAQTVPHAGDLYEMLYPTFTDGERDVVYGGTLDFTYGQGGGTQPDSITILTQSEKEGSLLVYRDSFGNLLYPYLADSYGEVRFSRSTRYDLTVESDGVLIELVERNLRYLIENAAILPAPMRELSLPEAEQTIELACSETSAGDGLVQWKGTLPMEIEDISPIYLIVGDTAYEALCLKDNGFAAVLPEEFVFDGVAVEAEGQLRYYRVEQSGK